MYTKPASALTLLIILGFIWGTGYSIARFATTHGVPPLGYSFWQALGPAIVLCFLMKKSSAIKPTLTLSKLTFYLLCGLTGIVIPNTNMYFAAAHLPVGILAVIVNTVPIFVYILSIMARVETFNFTRFLGVLTAILGLMLILIPETSLPSDAMVPWVLSALITPLSFAIFAVFISRYAPKENDSLTLSRGMLIAASVLLAPFVFFSKNFYMFHFPLQMQDNIILLEIILSSIGYILFFKLIKTAGPVYYSLVDTIVALTGLFWGYIIFHEKLNIWTTPAVILILFALILVTKEQHRLFTTRETRIC